jgi:TonB family protein
VTIAAPQSPPPLAPVPLANTDPLPGKRPSTPAATGTIDPKALETFLNARFPLVRACYERRLKVDPLLEGTVDLRITLSTSGRVAHIGVNRDTLKDAPMLDCVKATIRSWKFPPPTRGRVVFDKPFEFRRRS